MRSISEYVVQFGTPKVNFFKMNLRKVQKKAGRFVTSNYTGGLTGILEQLKLESLKKRGKMVGS